MAKNVSESPLLVSEHAWMESQVVFHRTSSQQVCRDDGVTMKKLENLAHFDSKFDFVVMHSSVPVSISSMPQLHDDDADSSYDLRMPDTMVQGFEDPETHWAAGQISC